MRENKGLISVIIPCYNQSIFLVEALESVHKQTYINWECIIVNDGSPDETEEVALHYCNLDKRFVYLKKENGGLSSARNAGLKIAKGEFIQFLDADDFISEEKFESSMHYFNDDYDLSAVITDFKMFDSRTKNTFDPYCNLRQIKFNLNSILFEWDKSFTIPIHCFLIRNSGSLLFNEKLSAKEDWVFWSHFFSSSPKVVFTDSYLAFYRNNSNGMTKNSFLMKESYVEATKIIYQICAAEHKSLFFNSVVEKLYNDFILSEKNNKRLINSHSYKVGNFVIRTISYFRRVFKKS